VRYSDPVLALIAERDRLSQRAEELRAEADKIWHAIPAELRERRVRINCGGRTYKFVGNPKANREKESWCRVDDDYLRRFRPNSYQGTADLDQSTADKVNEILCEQIAQIEAAWESSGLRALRREADDLDTRVERKMFDQVLETVATTPEGSYCLTGECSRDVKRCLTKRAPVASLILRPSRSTFSDL
jgi:hypothetical protein